MLKKLIVSSFIVLLSFTASPAIAASHHSSHVHIENPGLPYPMDLVSPSIVRVFTCVIHHESTSTWAHPNLRDNRSDGSSSGVFQIQDALWREWTPLVGFHMHVWQATYRQQVIGALVIYKHDGWVPWWHDGCFV